MTTSRALLLALLFALVFEKQSYADEGPNPGPTPAVTKEVTKPAIAPPAPNAPPEKVEKAKDVAKAAQLTPIEPSPHNPLRPAFQLYLEIDAPILALATVFGSARLTRTQPAYCAPLCDETHLNAIDRLTAGKYSPSWSTASDYALYGTIGLAVGALVFDEGPFDALNDSVVIAESVLGATGVASILTLAEGRPRPLLYSTLAPLSERNSPDSGLSFISSHTSVTAAFALSMFMTMRRLHPEGPAAEITLAIGGAATVFVGLARVEAGKHFITDVVGGALVGGALGTLIPALHGSPVRLIPVVSDTQRGLGVGGTF
jgi:membrane-associated phospholipid phosphatase